MTERLTTLRKQLEELRGAGSRLGRTLRAAALSLDSSGAPIPASLIADLRSHRHRLAELKSLTMEAAADAAHANPRDLQAVSLGELSAILRKAEDHSRRRREAEALRAEARTILGRAASIYCPDDLEFAPLAQVRAAIERLESSIAHAPELEFPEEAVRLTQRQHPLTALLTLLEEPSSIDDDAWATLH